MKGSRIVKAGLLLGVLSMVVPRPAAAQRPVGVAKDPPPRREAPAEVPRIFEPVKPDRVIEIAVTADGFDPSSVTVKKGERIRLVVKRKTDDTKVREFILDEFLIWKRLPLNEAVSDEFTTGRAGEFTFKSGDGTVTGTFTVADSLEGKEPK